MSDYPYATGDLLSNPNTYFYTKYDGVYFFASWMESRKKAILSENTDEKLTKSSDVVSLTVLEKSLSQKAVDTNIILDSIYDWLDNHAKSDDKGLKLIDQLVKTFEVRKRVYDSYSGLMKPVDSDQFRDLSLYLRTAEVFEVAYACFGRVQYLNAFIKVMDILSAFSSEVAELDNGRLSILIAKEKNHISELAESVGVSLC